MICSPAAARPSPRDPRRISDSDAGSRPDRKPWLQSPCPGTRGATAATWVTNSTLTPRRSATSTGRCSKRTVAAAVADHHKTHGAGSIPAGLARWAEQTLRRKVHWCQQLASALRPSVHHKTGTADYTWQRPSRRQQPQDVALLACGAFRGDAAGSWPDDRARGSTHCDAAGSSRRRSRGRLVGDDHRSGRGSGWRAAAGPGAASRALRCGRGATGAC